MNNIGQGYIMSKPFLRWAGGKSWFTDYFINLIKNINFNHYHEPFLGGAAIFFSVEAKKRSYLSDLNEELINTYITVRDNPQEVIEAVRKFGRGEKEYYRVRNLELHCNIEKAARFIYLNHTSYNGIYRVSKKGKYNVPYGKRDDWTINDQIIIEASAKLKNTNIKCGDFTCNRYSIKPGDLVFLDPPYTVSHNNNGFIEYNQKIFALEDQYRLSKFIDQIKRKDAYYILTNAAHESIKEIFDKNDRRIELDRQSLIGGKNAKREKIKEYIFTNIAEE